ncbi:MAG: hypothetical protein IJ167_08330 [Lachnospiraceae bacterium]|nr:hypothetical protein [Lachnospiraceae bacterium]
MKFYKIIYITVFFIIISIPFIAMPFYKQHENTENKVLLEKPELIKDGKYNINYLSELKNWYEEHFAFRQEMVTANALLKGKVFGESSEDLAIVGEDGWLYLKVSIDDYQGTNLASLIH